MTAWGLSSPVPRRCNTTPNVVWCLSSQASFVYEEIVANNGISNGEDVKVDQRLALYNDLFNFSRIAVTTLMDCPPPDLLYGPSPKGIYTPHNINSYLRIRYDKEPDVCYYHMLMMTIDHSSTAWTAASSGTM